MLKRKIFTDEIDHILDQLLIVYKPEKVILFGSLANGEIRDGTDIDLFIIKSEVPHLGVDRIRQLDRLIRYKLATDFVVYKPEEVRKGLKIGDPFVREVLQNGKVLYDEFGNRQRVD